MALRRFFYAALIAAALGGVAAPASAHPHLQVTSQSELIFAPDGTLKAIRHTWTFDEVFSEFATQGLDTNKDGVFSREELAELAKVNMESLKDFGYFTFPKLGEADLALGEPVDYYMEYKDKLLTVRFTLPVKAVKGKGDLSVGIYDPTYFIAFALAENDPAKLTGAAGNCTTEIKRPDANPAQTPMSESFFNQLNSASQFGAQFANRITVKCR